MMSPFAHRIAGDQPTSTPLPEQRRQFTDNEPLPGSLEITSIRSKKNTLDGVEAGQPRRFIRCAHCGEFCLDEGDLEYHHARCDERRRDLMEIFDTYIGPELRGHECFF